MLPEKVNFCPWFPSSRLGKRENLESLLVPKGFPGPGEKPERENKPAENIMEQVKNLLLEKCFCQ
jgi:hypothetical protein